MLEEREIITDTTVITFFFKLPTVTPTEYIFKYRCRHLSCEAYYQQQAIRSSESVNYFRTGTLYPGSQCEVNLLTVYHPGSLDTGLFFIVNTYLAR